MDAPMKFYEVGKGGFARDAQNAFNRAQKIAFDRGLPVTISMKMEIGPPDADDPQYGSVQYEVHLKEPARKSVRHTTLLSGGLIVSDGTDAADALQYDMFDKKVPEKK